MGEKPVTRVIKTEIKSKENWGMKMIWDKVIGTVWCSTGKTPRKIQYSRSKKYTRAKHSDRG